MKYRIAVSTVCALIVGVGAGLLSAPRVEAQSIGGYECSSAQTCTVVNPDTSCTYGQLDQYENCHIEEPPPCPECIFDCCVVGGAS